MSRYDPFTPTVAYQNSPEGHPLSEVVSMYGLSGAVIARTYANNTHNGLLYYACGIQGVATNNFAVGYDWATRVSTISNSSAWATFIYPNMAKVATQVVVHAGSCVLSRTVGWDFETIKPRTIAYRVNNGNTGVSYTYGYAPGSSRISSESCSDGISQTYQYDTQGRLVFVHSSLSDEQKLSGQDVAYAYDPAENVLRAGPVVDAKMPRYSFVSDDRNVHVLRKWGSVFELSGTAVTGAIVTVGGKIAERQGERFRTDIVVNNTSSAVRTNIAVVAFMHDAALDKDVVACVTGTLVVAQANEVPVYNNAAAMIAESRMNYGWDAFGRLISAESPLMPDQRILFSYYPDGRRATKTI